MHNLRSFELTPHCTHLQRRRQTMGAVTLGEAIDRIRDWSMHEGRAAFKPAQVGEIFGSLVFNDSVQQARLPKAVYQALRDTVTKGHAARDVDRRRGGLGAQGLGGRTRRVALHALVPADDRHHRREARLVLRADRRRQLDGRVHAARNWSRASPTRRASRRAACAAPSRRAATRRGIRPARRGCSERQLGHAGDPDRVRELDRRVARQEDAAAALDGGAVDAGGRAR